jgi:hypothetical protein
MQYNGYEITWAPKVSHYLSNKAQELTSAVETPRDLTKKTGVPMTFAHYLNHMALLTNQWTNTNFKDPERQRIYMKDIDCPQLWHNKLESILPPFLYYLNDSTGDVGGLGAIDEPDPSGSGYRRGKGIAKAGDLMSCLPEKMRAENMMCYIGHEGTYTPAHREMCASLGQNIMVEASTGMSEDGKPTKPGSSLWFMTENKEREVVAEYWLSRLGHDIELENHFAQINAWRTAPFKTYVVEQKPGDLILIPPLAPHQVWNRGTRTMKVAWNRTTVETLEMALAEALPKAQLVCRDEQYKNKAIVYFSLHKYSKLFKMADKHKQSHPGSKHKSKSDIKVRQLQKDFRRLHGMYTQMLVSESFQADKQEKCEMVPYESFITCSYCRCNIFNRFLTCPSCVIRGGDEEDTYDVCLDCYAMGRSCACISKLRWVEQFNWLELIQRHEAWRQQILTYESKKSEKSPMSLKIELQRLGSKRTLAQICQMELSKRPWRDIKKPPPQTEGIEREEEVQVDENGNLKKKKKIRRSERFVREHATCHIDKYWEPKWKQAQCSNCSKSYCFGTLFRAYDLMPQDILADPDWTCPSCRSICGCRDCRKKPGYRQYIPSGTRLGHNTKAVADHRSVESLVDFSFSNIGWIQKAGDDSLDVTRRLKKRRLEADAAQARGTALGDDYVDEETSRDDFEERRLLQLAEQEQIPIDPSLAAMNGPLTPSSQDPEDQYDENPEAKHETDYSRSHLEPQYVIPQGGILRDSEHAYEWTDAITYDYPDPNVAMPVAPVVIADEPESNPGEHGPAELEDDTIEMVSRKRKRGKLDEGERAFNSHKKASAKPPIKKKKNKQSLIVKFSISTDRLAEASEVASEARQALHREEAYSAPVIGSDLQALNVRTVDGQPTQKRPRNEPVVVEDRDDEYAPSRRRRRANGSSTAPRDDDVTRRQTRMQAVTYEEPSEEEFDEVLETGDQTRVASKRATMENPLDIDDVESGSDDSQGPGVQLEADLDAERMELDVTPEPVAVDTTTSPASQTPNSRPSMLATTPAISTNTQKGAADSRMLAQVAANRKVKMAVMDGLEDDSDSLDDEVSADESDKSGPGQSQTIAPSHARSQPIRAATPHELSVSESNSRATSSASMINVSVPSRVPIISGKRSMKIMSASTATVPSKSKLAVTAGDWSDSESELDTDGSDIQPGPSQVGGSWTAINNSGRGRAPNDRGRDRGY